MLGLAASLAKGGVSLLTYVKDNLKLYLDFKSSRSDTLAFPSEGSTSFNGTSDYISIGAIGNLGTDCTVTFWINRTDSTGNQFVWDARGASNGGTGYVYFSNGGTVLNVGGSGTVHVDGVQINSGISVGNWHFIAITGQTLNINQDFQISRRLNNIEFFDGKLANFAIWSRSLSLEEINSVMNKSYSQLGSVEKTSLVSWWALDTNYTDSHGSNDGTNSGSTITTSVYGGNAPILPRAIDIAESQAEAIGNGSALFQRANNDYIDCGNILNSSWCSSGDFTIAVWVYPITNTVNGGIVGIRGSSGTTLQLYLQNGFKFKSYNETGASGETSALTANVWTHVAMVQDGSNKKFYFNGILDTTTSQNPSNAGASESFTIGFTGNPSSNENFDGKLSQLGAWAGALTQAQIQSVMESTSYAKIPADVKSTLGSELVTSITNSSSNPWETFSGASGNTLASATNDAGTSGEMFSQQLGLSANTLVKVTVTVTLNVGTIKVQFCSTDGSITSGDLNETISSSGTHSFYTIISHADKDSLWVKYATTPNDISNLTLSVKEVTNDLVAYYPLDSSEYGADISVNGNVETWSSPTALTGWYYGQGSVARISGARTGGSGNYYATYTPGGSSDQFKLNGFAYSSGVTYQLEFWLKGTSADISIHDGSSFLLGYTTVTGLSSSWDKYTYTFIGSGNSAEIRIRPYGNPVSVDDLTVKPLITPDSTDNNNHGSLI